MQVDRIYLALVQLLRRPLHSLAAGHGRVLLLLELFEGHLWDEGSCCVRSSVGRHGVVLGERLLCVVDQVGLAVWLGLSSCVLAVVAIDATPRLRLALRPAGALLDHAIRGTVRGQGTVRVVLVSQLGHPGSTIGADIEHAHLGLGALAEAAGPEVPHDNTLPQVLLHGLLTRERLLVGLQRHVLAPAFPERLGWPGGHRGLRGTDSGRQADLCHV